MAGWIGFAAIVMLTIGMLTFFEGLIAIVRDNYFVATPSQIIVFDVTTWGWLMLFWGIILFFAGLGLANGSSWARWFTIVALSIHVLGQLAAFGSISSYPLWSLTSITLSIIVLYALTARWAGFGERVW